MPVYNLDPHYGWPMGAENKQGPDFTHPNRLPNNRHHAWFFFDEIFYMEFWEMSYKLFLGVLF